MLATLCRAASRKGIAAGLAALVATAGIGVAVAAPSGTEEEPEAPSAITIGASDGIDELVDDASSEVRQVDVPEPPPVVDAQEEAEQDPAPSPPRAPSLSAGPGAAADAIQGSPPVDARQFLPEGGHLDSDVLKGFLPGGPAGDDVAEGAEALADEVIARIQACVGDAVAQFGSGFDFGGPAEAGGDQAFATTIVEDVLPCAAGLVEDAISCVSGLVEEILATVMGMELDEIAGLAGVIVEELVDCVGGAQAD